MKNYYLSVCFFLSLILFSDGLFAQCILHHPDPPGYTQVQLRYRNVLKVDANGHPWIGFRNIGVGKFDGTNWTFYDRSNSGLPGNNVLSIAFMGNDTWIGTDSGLVKFDGTSWTLFNTSNSGILDNRVRRLFVDGSDLWLAFNSGLQLFDGLGWVTYNQGNGLANDTVECFAKAGSSLYFGTRNGLSEWNGSNWITHNLPSYGYPSNYITSLETDTSGTLFICSSLSYAIYTGILYYKMGSDIKPVAFELPLYYSPVYSALLLPSVNGSVISLPPNNYPNPYFITEFSGNPIALARFGCFSGALTPGDTNEVIDCSPSGKIWGIPAGTGSLYSVDYLSNLVPDSLPADYGELNINQVRARLHNDGDLFWDRIGMAQYEVPKNQLSNSIFCHSLWMGGIDGGGNLHMAGQTYRQSGSDFWPGPVDTVTGLADTISSAQYDKIWVVDRWLINDFISNFNAGNVGNGTYTIPPVILTWPGNGAGNFSMQLAPFVDISMDGVYDPFDGDYPAIRGDQMAWWVMNDTLGSHAETGGRAFGAEIQVSAYAYNCPLIADSDRVINYTTFYSYKIINRSTNTYHDVYLGSFTDVDLGLFTDDYVGCNVENDFAFGYNGDAIDEGIYGYGAMPPFINIAQLSGPLADAGDLADNNHNGIVDEPAEHCMMQYFQYFDNDFTDYGNPEEPDDFYGYLTGKWKDSSLVTYGGNGHTGAGVTCRYMFPGDSDPTGIGTNGVPQIPWDEYTSGNLPADRRFVMSSGPITMNPGDTRYLDYAIVFSRNENAVNYPQDVLVRNLSDVQKIKSWWTTGNLPGACSLSIGTYDLQVMPLQFTAWPNPFDNAIDLTLQGPLPTKTTFELMDVTGRILARGEIPTDGRAHIRTPDLAHGMYYIRISDGARSAGTKLVRR